MNDTLTTQEAAELMKISPGELLKLAVDGEIPGICFGDEAKGIRRKGRPSTWVFLREDLLAYLKERARKEQARRLARGGSAIETPRTQSGRRRGSVDLNRLP
ncbi:helix-turn-helix domain-containing protein [Methylohalobius crimeensis]|uniref:helix-turn-helix domain-containing protein n=1 Tax=Methylohalobius crimeensis TaxID=244365 RepID=UPI000A07BB85|nr:helix-turn-helix domain-containing protein [Methylohalobius crimeensis]